MVCIVNSEATVLVVDDDPYMRDLLTRVFMDAGIAVRAFESARELLDTADLVSPAVLLLDMEMPGLSGLDLQGLLHARGVTLPVIFLTGAASVPQAVAAMRNGAVDFIEKPFDGDALVARIRLTYGRHVAPDSSGERESDHETRLASLTPRERAVLALMTTGQTSKMMARELGGSFRTIEIHRSRVMAKMGVSTLADLVRITIATDMEKG